MFKALKNIFLNSLIITKTTGTIPPLECPASLVTHRFPDPDYSLQYRTTNFRNLPDRTKDDDKESPPINFSHNSDCGRLKQHASPSPYIDTDKKYLERKLQKQFVLPVSFPPYVKKKEKHVSEDQKRVSPNDLLSYCVETSITSPKHSRYNLERLSKYFPYPRTLVSCPESSPRRAQPPFPNDDLSKKLDEAVYPPNPPWRAPIVPCPAMYTQPYDIYENLRLLKLPSCPPCPSDCREACPPPPLRSECYMQPCESTLPSKSSPPPFESHTEPEPESSCSRNVQPQSTTYF
ncbi:uncharacterized protein LOC113232523 isoform X2 [Hyposmocoma kahamanoa]|uniref:uncharacterized protein LOC113232523 isoform X2 n=1 Tax=Hyposmocoma kahamanoa TaxID=1477025 RepID=UPI000E6D7353|nr:uncharacterized protein LOC113232523 isoform X2 [Hyposmocoma kahamanoa]